MIIACIRQLRKSMNEWMSLNDNVSKSAIESLRNGDGVTGPRVPKFPEDSLMITRHQWTNTSS